MTTAKHYSISNMSNATAATAAALAAAKSAAKAATLLAKSAVIEARVCTYSMLRRTAGHSLPTIKEGAEPIITVMAFKQALSEALTSHTYHSIQYLNIRCQVECMLRRKLHESEKSLLTNTLLLLLKAKAGEPISGRRQDRAISRRRRRRRRRRRGHTARAGATATGRAGAGACCLYSKLRRRTSN